MFDLLALGKCFGGVSLGAAKPLRKFPHRLSSRFRRFVETVAEARIQPERTWATRGANQSAQIIQQRC